MSQDIQGDLRRNACTAFKNHPDYQTFSNTILTLKRLHNQRQRVQENMSKGLLCPPSEFRQNHSESNFAFDNVSCGSILLVFGLLLLGGG